MGKVNDSVGFQTAVGWIGVDWKAGVVFGIEIKSGDDGTVAPFGSATGDDSAPFLPLHPLRISRTIWDFLSFSIPAESIRAALFYEVILFEYSGELVF